MGETNDLKRRKGFSRITLLALLLMAGAMLHLSAFTAQAASVGLSWSAPTTYTDGTPVTGIAGYKLHVGTASRNYQQHLEVGNLTSYSLANLTDGSTYYFAVTAYNAAGSVSGYSNEVVKVLSALPITYQIAASSGTGGTITALNNTKVNVATNGTTTLTNVTVSDGASQAFSIVPAAGYAITDVRVDGASIGPVTSYSFNTVKANHTLSATFAIKSSSYTITASAGTGGSITPSGAATLTSGASKTYAIAAAAGYSIAGVTVDGASVGRLASYTFSNVTANHSIQATFAAATTSSAAFAVNAGGSTYTNASGVSYLTDSKFSGGTVSKTTATIRNTTEGTLYQSERYGNFSYSVPMANGNYNVTLKFAEGYFTAAGKRIFSVAIGGKTVISNLDLYAKVGQNAAYDVVVPVSVTNGVLSIKFISQVNNAEVRGIKVVPSLAAPAPAPAPAPATGTVAFAANAGGSSYTNAAGLSYPADSKFSGGTTVTRTAAINGTTEDTLYQSERYGNFSYTVPMANGNYGVTLKFAEGYFTAAGKRVFSVAIGGKTVISNLDLYAKAGLNTAYDVTIPVSVTNGTLKIDFISQVNNAKVGAILVKAL